MGAIVITLLTLLGLIAGLMVFGADSAIPSLVGATYFLALAGAGLMFRFIHINPMTIRHGVVAVCFGVIVFGQIVIGLQVEAIIQLFVLASAGACFILGQIIGVDRKAAERALFWGMLILLAVAGLSFVDFISNPGQAFGRVKSFHQTRLTGPFLSANTAATFFTIATILGFGAILRAAKHQEGGWVKTADALGRKALLPIVLVLFSLTCLVLTGSRAGIAVAGVALALLFVWERLANRQKTLPTLLGVVGLGIIGALILAISGEVAHDRLAELSTDTTGRAELWCVSVEAWKEAIWFGHGFDQFTAAINPHITQETAPYLIMQGAAHNIVLQWLVQTGLIGTVSAAVLVATLGWDVFRGLKKRRRMRTTLRTVIVIGGAICLHGMLDFALEIPAFLWWSAFLLGIGSGIANGASTSKGSSNLAA